MFKLSLLSILLDEKLKDMYMSGTLKNESEVVTKIQDSVEHTYNNNKGLVDTGQ